MKILIIGKNNVMQWPQSVARTLTCMGIDNRLFLFNRQTLFYYLRRLQGKEKRTHALAKSFERQIKAYAPDIILFVSTFSIPAPFFEVLAQFPSIKKAGWSGDNFGEEVKKRADYLDILFCTDSGFIPNGKGFKCKIEYMPLCVEESVVKTSFTSKTERPFFAAVANPLRTNYLKACKSRCLIYGKGWDKKQLSQHEIHNHKISHQKQVNLIAKSIAPINICFSPNIINGVNFRVFEAGASGGLIMVNKQSSDISRLYEIGHEAVVYESPEDLNLLILDIEKNPQKYVQIAQNGYQRTLRDHTYRKRLEQMLHHISLI